jgi:hypothetical protein
VTLPSSSLSPPQLVLVSFSELLSKSVQNILAYSNGETINVKGDDVKGKKRNFLESIELQVSFFIFETGDVWFMFCLDHLEELRSST